jgi:hypothetical protein
MGDVALRPRASDGLLGPTVDHLTSGYEVPEPDPNPRDYGSYAGSSDPDGNGWVLQEVRHRAPSR